jgi:hypothetical protein
MSGDGAPGVGGGVHGSVHGRVEAADGPRGSG